METEWLRWLYEHLPKTAPGVLLGVGDDAAVLDGQPPIALASDMIMDGAHFDLATCGAEAAGRKALAVNLSDLAAVAARPTAALLNLALPRGGAERLAHQVLAGVEKLAADFQVCIAGGDTNVWDGPLVISLVACGRLDGAPWTRSGARPNDRILVTGPLGGGIAGKHLNFVPLVSTALRMRSSGGVRAAIDISDGLSLDLDRMARASGCGACLTLAQVPISQAALRSAGENEALALQRALGEGEDFELLLAVAPENVAAVEKSAGHPLIDIGCFVESPGLFARTDAGDRELVPSGYEHGGAGAD